MQFWKWVAGIHIFDIRSCLFQMLLRNLIIYKFPHEASRNMCFYVEMYEHFQSHSTIYLLKVSKCQAVYPRNVKVLINCKCNRFFTAHAFLHCGWFWLHRKKTFLESKTYVIYDALILMMLIALSLFILQLEKVFSLTNFLL